ncbi:hypothetical protein Y900_024140 [Mycolicibacterium aromaticivorans JS19b1 = JCM 16368]|uniref:Uncharacterized protein n=1 Tax=Mycolicibacterium aromaticivorans JS19b1 = JCM 16368 TaxID=1440774 RepID=A0A064CSY4_9MYCO|nr:hypothetical protein [Mycolicibacterium aromaticivorans]KDF01933.1 hypothetical protein Y900_024140 [Mycolicibacterium aromaticivorans JS19b1 = JCM 16368]
MSDLAGIEQLPQPDPRGWLALRDLPAELQNTEDSTHAADSERYRCGVHGFAAALWGTDDSAALTRLRRFGDRLLKVSGSSWRAFARPATPAERVLLAHLGHAAPSGADPVTIADDGLPAELITIVDWPTSGVRNRRWPQLETTTGDKQ